MSIYSGFSTRQIEQSYNIMVEQLFRILQRRILKFYRQEEVNEIFFAACLKKLLTQMSFFERQKTKLYQILTLTNIINNKIIFQKNQHLPPKFSDNIKELTSFLKLAIPSNISIHYKKKTNNLSQSQLNSKKECEQTNIVDDWYADINKINHRNQKNVINIQQLDQLQIQNNSIKTESQKSEMDLRIGEPQKSEINASEFYNHSLFPSHQMYISNQNKMNFKGYFKEIQSLETQYQQTGQNNIVTLDVEYHNSTSSISHANSFSSSFTSLRGRDYINKTLQTTTIDQNKSLNTYQIKDTSSIKKKIQQMNQQVNQIAKGEKNQSKMIHNQNQDIQQIERKRKIETLNYETKGDSFDTIENLSNKTQLQSRVIRQQQQKSEQLQNQNAQQESNEQLSPEKQILQSKTNENSQFKKQNVMYDESNYPHINQKKNSRSHTTKRQRKKNKMLNSIYSQNEDTNIQNDSHSPNTSDFDHRRSRSTYRSSENPNRNTQYIQSQKIHKDNNICRPEVQQTQSEQKNIQIQSQYPERDNLHDNVINSFKNITHGKQIQSNKSKIENIFIDNSVDIKNKKINNQFYNSSMANSQIDGLTSSIQTIFSIKQDKGLQQLKVNKGTLNKTCVIEQSNQMAENENQDKNNKEQPDEPLQNSLISPQIINQENKYNSIRINTENNNTSFEFQNIFYPYKSNNNNRDNSTPKKRLISQNNSAGNSLLNTQNNFLNKSRIDQNIAEVSNFNKMYPNNNNKNLRLKRLSGPQMHQKNIQQQQNVSNQSINSIDNSIIANTEPAKLDQCCSEEQIQKNKQQIFSKDNNSILNQKRKKYQFVQNSQQQINNQ